MEPEKKSFLANKKIIALSVGAVVLGAGITSYGLSAYSNGMWPFPAKSAVTSQDEPAEKKKEVKASFDTAPEIKKVADTETLNVRPVIQATTQGDCTMTITGNGQNLEYKNSTRGIEGVVGCLEFNADGSQLPAGTYDVKVDFVSDTESSSISYKLKK